MEIKSIEHCMHCVSYCPKTYRKLEDNGIVKLFIGCANQNKCPFVKKQFDNIIMTNENIVNLRDRAAYIMNSKMTVRDLLGYIKRTFKKEKGFIVAIDVLGNKKYYGYNGPENSDYHESRPTAVYLKRPIKGVYCKRDRSLVVYIVTI